jgi:hypothetical protein
MTTIDIPTTMMDTGRNVRPSIHNIRSIRGKLWRELDIIGLRSHAATM